MTNLYLLAIMLICGISATVLFLMIFSYYIQEWREEKKSKKLEDEYHIKFTLD